MSVFFFPENQGIITIEEPDLDKLKGAAATAQLRRARYCLHHSSADKVHEMIIAFCRDSIVPVHRHRTKTESFHVIEGIMEVLFYDDEGCETKKIKMGPHGTGLPFVYRLSSNEWHTIRPLSEFVIIHETTSGPFIKDEVDVLEMKKGEGE